MPLPERLLKHTGRPQHLPVIGEDEAVREDAPREAPGARGGVLRSREARFITQPYAVALPEFTPDFPVPTAAAADEAAAEDASSASLEATRAAWEAEWNARLAAELESARADAYAQGYAAARADLEAGLEAQRAAMAGDLARLKRAWKDVTRKSEPLLAGLAFEVAQQLLEAPLPEDVKAVSTEALARALEALADHACVDISLHPDDLACLQACGLADALAAVHRDVRWHPDPALTRGDWVAHTPEAAMRWLKQEVLTQLKSRLGLLAGT